MPPWFPPPPPSLNSAATVNTFTSTGTGTASHRGDHGNSDNTNVFSFFHQPQPPQYQLNQQYHQYNTQQAGLHQHHPSFPFTPSFPSHRAQPPASASSSQPHQPFTSASSLTSLNPAFTGGVSQPSDFRTTTQQPQQHQYHQQHYTEAVNQSSSTQSTFPLPSQRAQPTLPSALLPLRQQAPPHTRDPPSRRVQTTHATPQGSPHHLVPHTTPETSHRQFAHHPSTISAPASGLNSPPSRQPASQPLAPVPANNTRRPSGIAKRRGSAVPSLAHVLLQEAFSHSGTALKTSDSRIAAQLNSSQSGHSSLVQGQEINQALQSVLQGVQDDMAAVQGYLGCGARLIDSYIAGGADGPGADCGSQVSEDKACRKKSEQDNHTLPAPGQVTTIPTSFIGHAREPDMPSTTSFTFTDPSSSSRSNPSASTSNPSAAVASRSKPSDTASASTTSTPSKKRRRFGELGMVLTGSTEGDGGEGKDTMQEEEPEAPSPSKRDVFKDKDDGVYDEDSPATAIAHMLDEGNEEDIWRRSTDELHHDRDEMPAAASRRGSGGGKDMSYLLALGQGMLGTVQEEPLDAQPEVPAHMPNQFQQMPEQPTSTPPDGSHRASMSPTPIPESATGGPVVSPMRATNPKQIRTRPSDLRPAQSLIPSAKTASLITVGRTTSTPAISGKRKAPAVSRSGSLASRSGTPSSSNSRGHGKAKRRRSGSTSAPRRSEKPRLGMSNLAKPRSKAVWPKKRENTVRGTSCGGRAHCACAGFSPDDDRPEEWICPDCLFWDDEVVDIQAWEGGDVCIRKDCILRSKQKRVVEEGDDNVWSMEKIIGKRRHAAWSDTNRMYEYLVLWNGINRETGQQWRLADATWEPEYHVDNLPHAEAQFFQACLADGLDPRARVKRPVMLRQATRDGVWSEDGKLLVDGYSSRIMRLLGIKEAGDEVETAFEGVKVEDATEVGASMEEGGAESGQGQDGPADEHEQEDGTGEVNQEEGMDGVKLEYGMDEWVLKEEPEE